MAMYRGDDYFILCSGWYIRRINSALFYARNNLSITTTAKSYELDRKCLSSIEPEGAREDC